MKRSLVAPVALVALVALVPVCAACTPAEGDDDDITCAAGEVERVALEEDCASEPCECSTATTCVAPAAAGAVCRFRDENPADCATGFDVPCADGLTCVEAEAGDPACDAGLGFSSCCAE